ncbi:hypothetical protein [Pseudonocardia sp. T1-2H]|uniref:hypothetical protein n=1 Tax=Pseudonocardia sp. T1-2H TaxID=3128899 RepID=UPI003100CB71
MRETFAGWRNAALVVRAAGHPGPQRPAPVQHPRRARRSPVLRLGDSVVAHRFATMLVPLGFLRRFGIGLDDPRFTGARDAYLAGFAELAPGRTWWGRSRRPAGSRRWRGR